MKLSLSKNETLVAGGRKNCVEYVVAATRRNNRAICWASHVDGKILRRIFEEVSALGLSRPITIYGHTCTVGETESFRFEQVSSEFDGIDWTTAFDPTAPKRANGPMPRVTYDGQESVLKSRKTIVPDLNAMGRIEALQWLIKHTRPRGYSRNANPLRGLGGVIAVGTK